MTIVWIALELMFWAIMFLAWQIGRDYYQDRDKPERKQSIFVFALVVLTATIVVSIVALVIS